LIGCPSSRTVLCAFNLGVHLRADRFAAVVWDRVHIAARKPVVVEYHRVLNADLVGHIFEGVTVKAVALTIRPG
jgi:hypothetical protein